MKKHLLTVALSLIAMICYSQENSDSTKRTQEILLTTSSFSSGFGLQCKVKVFKRSFLRVGVASLYFDYSSNTPKTALNYPTTLSNYGFNMVFGLENRKAITEKFVFSYGFDLITFGDYVRLKIDNPNIDPSLRVSKEFNFYPGFGLNFGAILRISDSFYLGAEMNPQLSYSKSETDGLKAVNTKVSVNTKNVSLLLIYRLN
jgi:hypothetical protein